MLIIGERINTVRKTIALALKNKDVKTIQKEAIDQVNAGVDVIFLDPLDKVLVATLKAANALLGRDESCLEYIKAYREGKFKG